MPWWWEWDVIIHSFWSLLSQQHGGVWLRKPQATAKNTKSERCSKPHNSWALILSTFYPVHGPQDGNELFRCYFHFLTLRKRNVSLAFLQFFSYYACSLAGRPYMFSQKWSYGAQHLQYRRSHSLKLAWRDGSYLYWDARFGGLWPFLW